MGFQKFFLFWVAGIFLKGWEAELETGVVIGNIESYNMQDLIVPITLWPDPETPKIDGLEGSGKNFQLP